jgi:hypothetical protein
MELLINEPLKEYLNELKELRERIEFIEKEYEDILYMIIQEMSEVHSILILLRKII